MAFHLNGCVNLVPPLPAFRSLGGSPDLPLGERVCTHPPVSITRITTMLTPDERLRVDAVGMGFLHAYHRDSVHDVLRDLRSQRVRVVLVSTAMCQRATVTNMARMVREFPRIPAVALLSQMDRGTVRTVLSLGQCGVRTLVDVREPTGWRELRAILLRDQASDVQRVALSRLALDLAGCPEGCYRFFETLFASAAKTPTIRQLCRSIGIVPGTLMSRFFRAELPPPKRFLAYARLTCAAHLFENPGVSITSVANQLDYSSPQSFSRHVRSVLHMSAIEFRLRYDGGGMLECFRERLILPYRVRWRTFDPLGRKQVPTLDGCQLAATQTAGTGFSTSPPTCSSGDAG